MGLRTWIVIDRKAIAHNYRVFRRMIGRRTRIMAVVKSNAYGHNIFAFAAEMERLGADYLGVDSITEALALRKRGIKKPILVLGYTLPEKYAEARKSAISVTISSFGGLAAALAQKRGEYPLRVHIKTDTGMHRQGFQGEDMPQVLDLLRKERGQIVVEGVYTHFAEAKNPRFGATTRAQIVRFKDWVTALRKAGFRPIAHAGATGGAMLYPDGHFDMVRIGIGLYGLWPSDAARDHLKKKVELRSVLTWKAIIGEMKRIQAGEKVGYDYTESVPYHATIAIIPVGYWHGFPRLLSSKGRVLIGGKSAKILGRVSMDMIIADVTGIPKAKTGDEVVLIGKQGREEILASELAKLSGTTHYEIVTRLNPLMERIYC